MFKQYFLTTIRTLRQNPLYTALSVFGIAITFVFVCILFLLVKTTKGDYIPDNYAERTWIIKRIGIENGNSRFILKEDLETWLPKMKTPEMTLVTTNHMEEVTVINNRSVLLTMLGIGDNYFDIYRFKFLSGRPISKQEIADAVPVAVIDRNIATMNFGKDGDCIDKIIEMNAIKYRVVGVVDNVCVLNMDEGSAYANMWVPFGTAKTVNRSQLWYNISFIGKDKAAIADMQDEFTRVLGESSTAGDVQYNIPAWEKKSLKQRGIMGDSNTGYIIFCLLLMLIPALNILSLNVSKSFDRNEEIAIRKAFGAPMHTIFSQLLFENTLLTLAGAFIGMCVTPPLISAIDSMMFGFAMPMAIALRFDWTTIFIVAVPCVLVFSFLSGSVPAWITARKDIVNVLKGGSK